MSVPPESVAPVPVAAPVANAAAPATVRKGTLVRFLGAYLGVYMMLIVPVASTLAIKVSDVAGDNREAVLGVIAGIGALVAMLSNPIIGALSDHTTSRFGMRRPWILGGVIAGFLSLTLLAFAGTPLVVGIAWAATQLSLNAVLAGLAAFLPDRVPEQQRGRVSAFTGVSQQIAPFLGLLIANVALGAGTGTPGMLLAPAIIGLILVLIYVLFTRDRVLSPNLRQPIRFSVVFSAFRFNPRKNPDFAWAWIGRFLITLSFAASLTYGVYFMNERLHIPMDKVPTLQLAISAGTTILLAVSATVAGILSDRLKRRKVFVFVASALIAVASVLTAFSYDLVLYLVAAVITSIATGVYFAVDLALVTAVIPDKEHAAAKDMGVFNIANALPQSFAPAVAPLLLGIGGGGNFVALFVAAGVVAILGALTIIPIKGVR